VFLIERGAPVNLLGDFDYTALHTVPSNAPERVHFTSFLSSLRRLIDFISN
jgi:hypothetical protein